MNISKGEQLALKFLRVYNKSFSLKDMKKIISNVGIEATNEEILQFLHINPNVLELEKNKFITKSGAFTGEIFSIQPSLQEFDQGVMIIGDRCLPFTEADRIHSTYRFYIDGKKVPLKIGTFSADFAIDCFILYGEEYASQYIASDPANNINLSESNFELPHTVKLTGLDLDFLKTKFNLQRGDRILCCVNNWDECKINIMILHNSGDLFNQGDMGEKRLTWYKSLEKYFMESFEKYGPLGSIEEQICRVVFDHRKDLCVPHCGSINEFINRYAKNVSIEKFGVESRLWFKGKEIPAFGAWNIKDLNLIKLSEDLSFSEYYISSIPEHILDQMILTAYYHRNKSPSDYIQNLIVKRDLNLEDYSLVEFILHIKNRDFELSKTYNWFADKRLGLVREKAIKLYIDISLLVKKVDFYADTLVDFPQHEMIILSQLFGHLLQIIEVISFDSFDEENFDSFCMSLEGMEWNFEEIKPCILASLKREEVKKFRIVNSDYKKSNKQDQIS